jgi:MFS family permease
MTEPRPPSRALDARIVAVVSVAHGCSHFFHLIVAPLFPWLKADFGLGYAELGLLMTVFFAVSGIGQALAGFLVDRIGPVPVMLASLACFVVGALTLATAPGYPALILGCALVGLGNAPFHPVDYSILNARIATPRLAHAYSVHGIAGNLGWALAPVFLVGIAQVASWRVAIAAAAAMAAVIGLWVWRERAALAGVAVGPLGIVRAPRAAGAGAGSSVAFLRLPAVWMSFAFFLTMAVSFGAIQTFGPEAAGRLHGIEAQRAALYLTVYMLASAAGIVLGGFVASDPQRAEPTIAVGYGVAACVALALGLLAMPAWAVPVAFAAMGVGSGIAGPSRDLLVRRASPPGATGRVYGLVYSGLDTGMALAPLGFGWLMDRGMTAAVWIGIAGFQALLILSAVKVGHLARVAAAAPAAGATAR